jgi:hypothetical protein
MSVETIVEQMRLHEGRLFQNEQVVALYLDVKSVCLDLIRKIVWNQAHPESRSSDNSMLDDLKKMGPKGYPGYHERVLYDTVRFVCKLLWPSEVLVVAKPNIETLLDGLYKRLVVIDAVQRGTFLQLDFVQQDLLLREAFRRTLINDCLSIFTGTEEVLGLAAAEGPATVVSEPRALPQDLRETHEGPNGLDTLDTNIMPDDSASHVGSVFTSLETKQKPDGAHSRLGPIAEDDAPNMIVEKPFESQEPKGLPSFLQPYSDSKSVMTRSVLVKPTYGASVQDAPKHEMTMEGSHVSRATAVSTSTSVLRKPMNVKKIVVDASEGI